MESTLRFQGSAPRGALTLRSRQGPGNSLLLLNHCEVICEEQNTVSALREHESRKKKIYNVRQDVSDAVGENKTTQNSESTQGGNNNFNQGELRKALETTRRMAAESLEFGVRKSKPSLDHH